MEPDELSEDELAQIERRAEQATSGPWTAFYGPGIGGEEFIRLSEADDAPDMYVLHDRAAAPTDDLKCIAGARQDVPRLLAEVRRLRKQLGL